MVNCEWTGEEANESVGRRVAVGKCHGTVRYEGPVPPAPGTWLGIEWDDPARGKHDGTYNGVRYFTTRYPTAGSFIRIEKADFGRSCVSAIKERYASNQLTLTVEELQDLQKAMNAPHLEMVGFDKINQQQSCLSSLQVICLHDYQVCCAGEGLPGMCPNTREIDLSSNLLTSWNQVADIIINFPYLHFINVSDNRLEIPEKPLELYGAFKSLSHMVLAHMDYSWEQICSCIQMWPQIQQLQVPFNNITSINIPENTLANLIYLDLEGNSISQWEEINKLGSLEQLESLNVCDLGLTNISLPASQHLFKNLQCLLLSDNKIEKWECVAELNKLPKLTELRFTHNPILDNLSIEAIHYKIIARVGSLKVLNRNLITREERRGAEMEYIKENGREWLKSENNETLRLQFLTNHPRYSILVKKYGAAEESELEVKNTSLNSSLVRVKLCSSDKTLTKSLPRTMLVTRLVSLVQRLFNTGATEPTLCYHSSKNQDIEVEMNNLLKTLDFYSIEDGDEIAVRW